MYQKTEKIRLPRPFRVYDIKNIDFTLSNKVLRFKYLVFSYQKSTLKATVETEVNAFNTISIATWEGAELGGPNENHKRSISDQHQLATGSHVYSLAYYLCCKHRHHGFAQPEGVVKSYVPDNTHFIK